MNDESNAEETGSITERTAEVVSAYVSNNPVPKGELPGLIDSIYKSLRGLTADPPKEEPKREPAVNPKRSVKQDRIICLECGKPFKSLKRHVGAKHDLAPEDYRQKWNLAADYPMTAPEYADQRSKLAKSIGLGRKQGSKSTRKKK